jgi:hypothetical protein
MQMSGVKFLSAAFALVLEAVMIFVLAQTGRIFSSSMAVRVGVGLVVCTAVIALWMVFAAPMSARRLAMPQMLWFKLVICGLAAVVLARTQQLPFLIFFVAFSIVSLSLEYASR